MTTLECNGASARAPSEVWLVSRRITFSSEQFLDIAVKCFQDEASANSAVNSMTQELKALGNAPVKLGGREVQFYRALSPLGITEVGYTVTRMPLEGVIVRPQSPILLVQ